MIGLRVDSGLPEKSVILCTAILDAQLQMQL